MPQLTAAGQEWALDFVSDTTAGGARFRVLSVLYRYTRQALASVAAMSLGSQRVTRTLEDAIRSHGQPLSLRTDNGPEFTSRHFRGWCAERGIALHYIQPGKPNQNAHIESFQSRLRAECLKACSFTNLEEARCRIENWRSDYNQHRPHSSLSWLPPDQFAAAASLPRLIVRARGAMCLT